MSRMVWRYGVLLISCVLIVFLTTRWPWSVRSSGSPFGKSRSARSEGKREVGWSRGDLPEEMVLGIRRDVLTSSPMNRLRVLPRLGAVFCPVPGVASRALLHSLERAEGVVEGGLPFLSEYALRDRERFLRRRDIFRFAFVRHPFSRILSAFYRGMATTLDGRDYREFMGHVRGHVLARDEHELLPLSFMFFLTFLNSQRTEDLWVGFMPQRDLCGFHLLGYSFIGKFEMFRKDLDIVEKRLQCRIWPLPSSTVYSNASYTFRDMFQSRRIRAKARKLYHADFKLLPYSPG